MKYRMHPQAFEELKQACAYYDVPQRGQGARFAEAVEEALKRVVENPTALAELEAGYRLCRLKRFPYGIVYRPIDHEVFIVALMHLARRPGYWKERLAD